MNSLDEMGAQATSPLSNESSVCPFEDSQFALLSPAELFEQIGDHSNVFWLDSAQSISSRERWSYLGFEPSRHFNIDSTALTDYTRFHPPVTQKPLHWRSFLRTLQPSCNHYDKADSSPPFRGGWIGFLSYELGAAPTAASNTSSLARLNCFEFILAYEHARRKWWACFFQRNEKSEVSSDAISNKIMHFLRQNASQNRQHDVQVHERNASSNMTAETYCGAVRRALEYIRAGDIYQLNLAQRFTVPWTESAASLYFRLREASPAAYGVFLGKNLVDGRNAICSVSPELFLKRRGREVLTCPIKGTRPRGATPAATASAGRELDSCAKERAELNMIIDVERNDLGRVCEYGSVKVNSSGAIQELPTLLHRVAEVSGTLRKGCGVGALLKATFPGGSITGAPKIRAMEIIRELEAAPRGPYCGAIGWLGADGDLELNIAIRTALVDTVSNAAHFHAGSGIVADSNPEREYEETLHKARAFFTATRAELR